MNYRFVSTFTVICFIACQFCGCAFFYPSENQEDSSGIFEHHESASLVDHAELPYSLESESNENVARIILDSGSADRVADVITQAESNQFRPIEQVGKLTEQSHIGSGFVPTKSPVALASHSEARNFQSRIQDKIEGLEVNVLDVGAPAVWSNDRPKIVSNTVKLELDVGGVESIKGKNGDYKITGGSPNVEKKNQTFGEEKLTSDAITLSVEMDVTLKIEFVIDGITQKHSINIATPDSSYLRPPLVTGLSSGQHSPFNSVQTVSAPFNTYGGYLRIKGQQSELLELRFVLLDNDGNYLRDLSAVPAPTSVPRGWEVELTGINQHEGRELSEGKILVRREKGDKHIYAGHVIEFESSAYFNPSAPPSFSNKAEVAGREVDAVNGVFKLNRNELILELDGSFALPENVTVVVAKKQKPGNAIAVFEGGAPTRKATVSGLDEGMNELIAYFHQGAQALGTPTSLKVDVRTSGPRVVNVVPKNFGTAPGVNSVSVYFDREHQLRNTDELKNTATYKLIPRDEAGNYPLSSPENLDSVEFDAASNSVRLIFERVPTVNLYRLVIDGTKIKDEYGNLMEGVAGQSGSNFIESLGDPSSAITKFTPDAALGVTPGIGNNSTGDYVPYSEYTKPRINPEGFNPNDKVETRVVRLYYYRDAHRVAQIINRKVKSYNRAAVDTHRRLADKARSEAEQRSIARQQLERNAIVKSQQTRQKEAELRQTENSLNSALRELTSYMASNPNASPDDDPIIQQLESLVDSFQSQVPILRGQVQGLRDQEVQANELTQQAVAQEKLAKEEQFRREVSAAHADPDTYAEGSPNSDDPIEQVTVSVVGEGLIQLRGPLKGINMIRIAIDQLDSPAGQVRVAVHTVQINGERADKMEEVGTKIQTHIDHARFMTMQTAEMLRRAVVDVASLKAQAVGAPFPGEDQSFRDQRYVEAFFGVDFVNELRAMDSEFLQSGNKLLSLHSMDTVSLASALNLIALAKNSTRQQIFARFEELVQTRLVAAEENYLASNFHCEKKHRFGRCHCSHGICSLAGNARFESVKGFFDTQGYADDDTMTPLQREFVRLAQIFKARLVTEREYKQRVMERALIEERLLNRVTDLDTARRLEEQTKAELTRLESDIVDERVTLSELVFDMMASVTRKTSNEATVLPMPAAGANPIDEIKDPTQLKQIKQFARTMLAIGCSESPFSAVRGPNAVVTVGQLRKIKQFAENREFNRWLNKRQKDLDVQVDRVFEQLSRTDDPDYKLLYKEWVALREMLRELPTDEFETGMLTGKIAQTDKAFKRFHTNRLRIELARKRAVESRRPLDYKKFLDMLVDDLEEKHIELLEGTRAHIANIDNYLKRVTTALDDDFNTQFYYPTFRLVRETGQKCHVQFGQTETTTILANNRMFAKADPDATMEFNLPHRDMLLVEGLNGAKAAIDDFGALTNDPTFLSLARLASGAPPSVPGAGSTGGMGVVRNVLPGLSSTTSEQLLSQNSNGTNQLGANLENLIPDPAIYKFETGTGFEIRPVIQPDGQAVVFDFNYMYTTNIREPVRADEKHLGRVKRHFIDTDVQLSNFELREVSRYTVALKASRTSKGVPLLEDIPVAGALFRPLPSDEASLQQNVILCQATIFPTLFDLMGLRWAPVTAELDPMRLSDRDFVVRNRHRMLENRVYDEASAYVDRFLEVPVSERRMDLYRSQETVPYVHPNGYSGPGVNLRDSQMQEGYQPNHLYPSQQFYPSEGSDGYQYGTPRTTPSRENGPQLQNGSSPSRMNSTRSMGQHEQWRVDQAENVQGVLVEQQHTRELPSGSKK